MVDRGTFSDMWNDLSFVDDRVKAFVPVHDSTMLDKSFVPTAWSVICARGKDSFNHGKFAPWRRVAGIENNTEPNDVRSLARFRSRQQEIPHLM